MSNSPFPFSLELPNGNGTHIITSAVGFRGWLDEEINYWTSLARDTEPEVSDRYASALREILRYPQREDHHFRQSLTAIIATAQKHYSILIHRDSVKGRFIESLRVKDDIVGDRIAAAAAAHLIGCQLAVPGARWAAIGVHRAIRYEEGDAYSVSTAAKTFEEVHVEITNWFHGAREDMAKALDAANQSRAQLEKYRHQLQIEIEAAKQALQVQLEAILVGFQARTEKWSNDLASEIERTRQRMVDAASEQDAAHKEGLARHEAELQALTKTYDTKLALAAPVSYWKEKKASHQTRAKCWGIAFVVSVIGGGFGIFAAAGDLLPESYGAEHGWPLARMLETAVLVTFAVWIMRMFARLFLSNLHLATDAGERIVMVTTYLSLLREGSGLSDGDRKLVIEALFRRTSTGIVKDDANPPVMLGALSRVGKD